MGLFSNIFGKSDDRWDELKKLNNDDHTLCYIIDKFFKIDNLSPDKVAANFEAEANYTAYGRTTKPSFLEEASISLKPTKSLEFALKPYNRGLIFPSWFYTVYPDVIKWMFDDNARVGTLLGNVDSSDSSSHEYIFRTLINTYKNLGHRLECGK